MHFDCYIGIDYSGAATSETRQKGIQVYRTYPGAQPEAVRNPCCADGVANMWSRRDVAHWLAGQVRDGVRFLAGIDHCFSLPEVWMEAQGVRDWGAFLAHVQSLCPVHEPERTVEEFREAIERTRPAGGLMKELRLTEKWTPSAKSPFVMKGAGQVGKSSFAGMAWLAWLRKELPDAVHFWPFDGFAAPGDKPVIVEIYPALLWRRYECPEKNEHARDAWSVSRWLSTMDERQFLGRYFHPPITAEEAEKARLEGWILGVA